MNTLQTGIGLVYRYFLFKSVNLKQVHGFDNVLVVICINAFRVMCTAEASPKH